MIDPVVERICNKLRNDDQKAYLSWWEVAALDAYEKGHHFLILDREWQQPYLSRFWLTKPTARGVDGVPWESRNSCLLHYFHKPDDAGALHDHPWPFWTTVLSGGYVEERFVLSDQEGTRILDLGCSPSTSYYIRRCVDDRTYVTAQTPHRVASIEDDTWTLVTTGDTYSHEWGFWPEGGQRVGWREYLHAWRR